MTDHSQAALAASMQMEGKKHALQQLQNGEWKLTLSIHFNDMPASIMKAPMGTRYMVVAVELDDDETPVQHEEASNEQQDEPEKPKRKWDELKPSNQAGIVCDEPLFKAYAAEIWPHRFDAAGCDPAQFVRQWCHVKSRSELDSNDNAAAYWSAIAGKYQAWKLAAAHGG